MNIYIPYKPKDQDMRFGTKLLAAIERGEWAAYAASGWTVRKLGS